MKRIVPTLLIGGIAVLTLLLPAAAGAAATTERVSVTSAELEAHGGDSLDAAVSGDGRYVAFSSKATDLVAGDGNAKSDVFVRDRVNGTTERVSVDSSEAEATGGDSQYASISADGRFVAFSSEATNLVASDTNDDTDIFLRDRTNGTTERVSVSSSEAQGDGGVSEHSSLSADGRFVAFESYQTGLVANDVGGQQDIFVRDRTAGTTEQVNLTSTDQPAPNGFHSLPAISANGNLVAFFSSSTGLVPEDTSYVSDIYVRDRGAGTTQRVSVNSNEEEAIYSCQSPPCQLAQSYGPAAISGDGRYIAFSSDGDNLAPGDTNPSADLFLRDMQLGTTERVNLNNAGEETLGGGGYQPSLSTDGRFVAFETPAYNLVAGDNNGGSDVFVRDRLLGTVERVSVTTAGAQVALPSRDPSISGDGGIVVFDSDAIDLVGDDTNGKVDVFQHAYDIDIDGVSDFSDNCPTVANTAGQGDDVDGDLAGDACDAPGTGNVDCNQAVNSVDALKVLRHNAGLSVAQSEPCLDLGLDLASGFDHGDVDCSGAINAVDGLKVLRAVAGLPVSTSCAGPVIGP